MKEGKRVRLCLDFDSVEKLADLVDALRDPQIGCLPPDVAVYEVDALDQTSVTWGNTFILKRVGDRADQFRLRFTTTTKEERIV